MKNDISHIIYDNLNSNFISCNNCRYNKKDNDVNCEWCHPKDCEFEVSETVTDSLAESIIESMMIDIKEELLEELLIEINNIVFNFIKNKLE